MEERWTQHTQPAQSRLWPEKLIVVSVWDFIDLFFIFLQQNASPKSRRFTPLHRATSHSSDGIGNLTKAACILGKIKSHPETASRQWRVCHTMTWKSNASQVTIDRTMKSYFRRFLSLRSSASSIQHPSAVWIFSWTAQFLSRETGNSFCSSGEKAIWDTVSTWASSFPIMMDACSVFWSREEETLLVLADYGIGSWGIEERNISL